MAETIDDLLAPILAGRRLTAWAYAAGLSPWTIRRIRQGLGGSVHSGTVHAIVAALAADGVQVDVKRVRAAIAATSRAAKRKRAKS